MISSGAQIRSARGFLGWSQADLAKAAGLHLNTIRKYEARHGQELHPDAQMGYVSERITIALHKAGVQLEHNPPGVFANRYLWDPEKRPPILKRWERYWKPDSKPGQERARRPESSATPLKPDAQCPTSGGMRHEKQSKEIKLSSSPAGKLRTCGAGCQRRCGVFSRRCCSWPRSSLRR